jgi:hypothetical protein
VKEVLGNLIRETKDVTWAAVADAFDRFPELKAIAENLRSLATGDSWFDRVAAA